MAECWEQQMAARLAGWKVSTMAVSMGVQRVVWKVCPRAARKALMLVVLMALQKAENLGHSMAGNLAALTVAHWVAMTVCCLVDSTVCPWVARKVRMTAGLWADCWAELTVSHWAVARDASRADYSAKRRAAMLGCNWVVWWVDRMASQKAARTVELMGESTAVSMACCLVECLVH
jgi:hypothetical protein